MDSQHHEPIPGQGEENMNRSSQGEEDPKRGGKVQKHQHPNKYEFWQDLHPSGLFQGLIKMDAFPEQKNGTGNLTDPVTMIQLPYNYLR